MKRFGLGFLFLLLLSQIYGQQDRQFAIHGGVGTDLNLGLAAGIKASIIPFDYRGFPLELGAELFYSHSVEVDDSGLHTYRDTTDLVVIGLLANLLINYERDKTGFYYIAGMGVSGVSVNWLETSETDSSLGTPYGTSGSQQSVSGITGGTILNLGAAYNMGNGFDFRLELPFLIIFSSYGQASTVAPSLTLMAGYRF